MIVLVAVFYLYVYVVNSHGVIADKSHGYCCSHIVKRLEFQDIYIYIDRYLLVWQGSLDWLGLCVKCYNLTIITNEALV